MKDFDQIMQLFEQLWPGKSLNRDKLLMLFGSMIGLNDYELLCADYDGRVMGFASTVILRNFWQEGLILYITTMVVDEKHRNKAIGRSLIERITGIARQKGCSRIELESAFSRSDAHSFYEKMGFQKRAYFFSKDIRSLLELN